MKGDELSGSQRVCLALTLVVGAWLAIPRAQGGVIRLPDDTNGARFGWSRGVMTGRVVNGETRFFVTGHVQEGDQIYEVKSNGPGQVATLVRNWGDIYKGRRLSAPSGLGSMTGGLLWDEMRQGLWVAYGAAYNVAGVHDPSLLFVRMNDDGSTQTFGPWRTSEHSQKTRGFLVRLPDGRIAVGASAHSGNANSPVGLWLAALPAFDPFTLRPDELDSSRASLKVQVLAGYDDRRPMPRPAMARDTYRITGWKVLYDDTKGCVSQTDPTFNNAGLRFDQVEAVTFARGTFVAYAQLTDIVAGMNYPPDGKAHMWYGPEGRPECGGYQSSSSEGTGPHSGSTRGYQLAFAWPFTSRYPTEMSATPLETISAVPAPLRQDVYALGSAWTDEQAGITYLNETHADRTTNSSEPRPVIHAIALGPRAGS
jgi:hypothetical protein